MLIRYGVAVNEMRGSAGGITIARNRFGSYVRSRTKPVNPKSPRQVAIRVIMMFLAESWRESPMTDLIRAAWQTYADSVNWTNKLGEAVTLTGFNAYMQCQAFRLASGFSFIAGNPVALGLPAGDPTFDVDTLSVATQDANIVFDDTMDWPKTNNALMTLYMGKPQNPTINFFNGPWRLWHTFIGSAGVPITSPQANIGDPPYPLVLGQKVWFEARIGREDFRVSTKFGCDPVIVEA